MNTQTVTPQTARLLADASFPQPAPAPGQWWGNGKNLIFIWKKWLDAKWEYIAVIEHLETPEPDVNRFYDISDFTGLVYLPTAADILRELPNRFSTHFNGTEFEVESGCYPVEIYESENLAEAAALAYLELKKN